MATTAPDGAEDPQYAEKYDEGAYGEAGDGDGGGGGGGGGFLGASSGDEMGSGGEEEEDEDHYEQIRNMMENPVIQPIQQALKKQLLESNLRVAADVRDREAELTEVKGKRELIGVELYGVQQQLAKLQMELENKHGALNQVVTTREKAQDNLTKLNQQLEEAREIEAAELRKLEKNQADLGQLEVTLRQVSTYNEELKGEVAVTRRATYKAEEAISKLDQNNPKNFCEICVA